MFLLLDDVSDWILIGDMVGYCMCIGFNLCVGDRMILIFLIIKIGYMYIRLILNINICLNKYKMGKDYKIMYVIDEKICESIEGLIEVDLVI